MSWRWPRNTTSTSCRRRREREGVLVAGKKESRHCEPTGHANARPRARKAEFVEADQCDLPSPVPFVKIFRFTPDPNQFTDSRRLVPLEGRIAIVTNAGRDAVDADGAQDEGVNCGRRSRVVLTPRRRRQVCGGNSAGDGDKKARSPGRARNKPLKPLRAGMPGESGCNRGDYARVLTSHLHARLRVR
jgi:hypothetical protein